jgi:tryptophan synthase alpha chain
MSGQETAGADAPVRGGVGAERIAAAFARRAADPSRPTALMPYLMGGYPTPSVSRELAQAYVDGGADLVELGVPYSDPLADGPVIHAAGTTALEAGVTPADVLRIGEQLAAEVPVVLMVYANLVHHPGFGAFVARLRDAGISGLIVPDLPIGEESAEAIALCDEAGVAFVPLIAPTTSDARAAEVAREARGFLYAVSVTGTTGERAALADQFSDVVSRAKAHATVPVGLGFGIATGEHAAQAAAAGADGVIVGSRLVRAAGEPDPMSAVSAVMADLARGLGR